MGAVVRIDDRGRLLLPEAIRKRLGLRPGGQAVVEERKDEIVVRPPRAFLDRARRRPLRANFTLRDIKALEDELHGKTR